MKAPVAFRERERETGESERKREGESKSRGRGREKNTHSYGGGGGGGDGGGGGGGARAPRSRSHIIIVQHTARRNTRARRLPGRLHAHTGQPKAASLWHYCTVHASSSGSESK